MGTFYYVHRFCESEIQIGYSGNCLSLPCDVRASSWRQLEWIWRTLEGRAESTEIADPHGFFANLAGTLMGWLEGWAQLGLSPKHLHMASSLRWPQGGRHTS